MILPNQNKSILQNMFGLIFSVWTLLYRVVVFRVFEVLFSSVIFLWFCKIILILCLMPTNPNVKQIHLWYFKLVQGSYLFCNGDNVMTGYFLVILLKDKNETELKMFTIFLSSVVVIFETSSNKNMNSRPHLLFQHKLHLGFVEIQILKDWGSQLFA